MSVQDNQKYKITTRSEEETILFTQSIELEKFSNMVICLEGDLGSGKTVFAKGLAEALGINEVITSPTFNIIKEYFSGKMPFYHVDVYRLDGKIDNLGLEDYFDKEGIIVIEWADTIKEYLPKERLEIKIKIISENIRVLILTPFGEKYENLCEAVL